MNFFRSEKISLTEDNLVAEVEAGMRDFVRGDVADLRRPARLPTTTDTVLEAEHSGCRQQHQFVSRARRRAVTYGNYKLNF